MSADSELYYLLAPMIASDTITFEQAQQWIDFRSEAKAQHPVPMSLEAAVDMALGYFRADPDIEAEREAAKITALHEAHGDGRGVCPDCGEPSMMDAVDEEMSVDLWIAIRAICDKYAFDQEYAEHGPDVEEC